MKDRRIVDGSVSLEGDVMTMAFVLECGHWKVYQQSPADTMDVLQTTLTMSANPKTHAHCGCCDD